MYDFGKSGLSFAKNSYKYSRCASLADHCLKGFHLSLNEALAALTVHTWMSTVASFLISLKTPHAVRWLRGFSFTQALCLRCPLLLPSSAAATGRLAPHCPIPDIHSTPPCSSLHLPYASLHCRTKARVQDTDRYAPAGQSIPWD